MLDKLKNSFSIFVKKTLTEKTLKNSVKELNLLLISNDVAVDTADEICDKITDYFEGEQIGILTSKKKILFNTLKEIIIDILTPDKDVNLIEEIKKKIQQDLPYVIVFLGVNGTGKISAIAKIAFRLKKQKIPCVIAASDTFRAGAIEQLERHATKLGIKLIKDKAGSDPAAIAYDAIEHAKARHKDVVLIDTAGRMQTNTNLMDEIRKIKRVSEPDMIVFVGDALAGNDVIDQAIEFNKVVGIDAAVLTKLDADAKGGGALSIAHAVGKPIIFVSVGQRYGDLVPFNPEWMLKRLFD